ncbi:S-layer homology domain-containing protein [Anoxynatronum buryatiense]|uniref:Polymorphic outer membrane protein repeat-containing protein n=1 Tax=Anoxynatronum buryatiense TaxID=489973 RepID=A0AA45WVU4_9CLOT|nr:S-layer homology domain-containing protein [Anoxynatronum buryatiense]SMP55245.1 polymorphic outer membrane protein repeat-containing protein [Anoxynatronum buryatiense]
MRLRIKIFLIVAFLIMPIFTCIQPVSAISFTVTNLNDSGAGSLRQAIADAADGDTILFQSGLNGTITLTSELFINKTLTIDGGDSTITISGNNACRVIKYQPTFTGDLTLKNLTLADGFADSGAGMEGPGNLNLINCTFNNNSAANSGGALFIFGSTSSIINCNFNNNSATNDGSAIYVVSSHPTITNCTFSNNSSAANLGTIWLNASNPTITNCIIWNNSGGSIRSGGSTATVKNSIIEGGYGGSDNMDVDPLLGTLGDYGGPVKTIPLLPGSPAIDAGTSTGAPSTDARGLDRVGLYDIGAFESQGFTFGSHTGTPQAAFINTEFTAPLALTIVSNDPLAPVEGGKAVFTAPSSGAGCTFDLNPTAIGVGGLASVNATANSTIGTYSVTASVYGVGSLPFSLTNEAHIADLMAIPGVTVPIKNQIPVTSIPETQQYTGIVTWNPADNPFKSSTVYTATIILTPKAGYTLTGVSENFFTVSGAEQVTNAVDSGVVTAVFPVTSGDSNNQGESSNDQSGSLPGHLISPNGSILEAFGAKFDIPPKAVNAQCRGAIEVFGSDKFAAPDSSFILGKIIKLTVNPPGNFLKPVIATLPFNQSAVDLEKSTLSIYRYDEKLHEWIELDHVMVDEKKGTVSGETQKTGYFAVITVEKKAILPANPILPDTNVPVPTDIEVPVLTDINHHWAEESINCLVNMNAVGGYPDNTFRPENHITRSEFVTILVKAFHLKGEHEILFDDTTDHWAKDYIAIATAHGIVQGYNGQEFGPDDLITREQMAVMIVKAAKLTAAIGELTFSDRADINTWATNWVIAATHNNLMSGYLDNTFRPSGIATRAEAATVICKALK